MNPAKLFVAEAAMRNALELLRFIREGEHVLDVGGADGVVGEFLLPLFARLEVVALDAERGVPALAEIAPVLVDLLDRRLYLYASFDPLRQSCLPKRSLITDPGSYPARYGSKQTRSRPAPAQRTRETGPVETGPGNSACYVNQR